MVRTMNNIDIQYIQLLNDILDNGISKGDRTGTGTISVFGRQLRHNMSLGFPLLTTKRIYTKPMITELKWFLRGDTNIKYLIDNGCHIWNGDAIKNYEKHNGEINWGPFWTKEEVFVTMIETDSEFAREWGDLGPIYGTQWREWNYTNIDQIANVISELKTNPDSRRLMVSAWNPEALEYMVLPPCHYGFQLYTRELTYEERNELLIQETNGKYELGNTADNPFAQYDIPDREISLMWNQRSVDVPLGLPFNIASYGILLHLFAKEVNMKPGELIANLGDAHIYTNQISSAVEQSKRTPKSLPEIKLYNMDILKGEFDCEFVGYNPHPAIKFPLSN